MGIFDKLKKKMQSDDNDAEFNMPEGDEGYVQIDTEDESPISKIAVKTFILEDFSDTNGILDALRKGKTIALVNIKPLKDKDLVELKRSINKLKKTCDAIEGDIAGFAEDWVVVCPSFVEIQRAGETMVVNEE